MAKKKVILEDQKSKQSYTITFSQPFSAIIQEGNGANKKLVIQSPAYYQNQINKFKAGEKVTLEIHNRKPKRTDAQNRYYWGVYLPLIGNETGERNLDKLHQLFTGKFLTTGIIEVLGEKVRMKKSTTELNVADFTMYIMDIEVLTGVEAPPTENYGLEPLR
jgi:hypothetical protein